MENGVSQKDVIKALGIKAHRIKGLREEHLASDDWYTDASQPGRPRIMYRQSGLDKLQVAVKCARILPMMVPRFVWAWMVGRCPNPRRVVAAVKRPDGGKKRVAVWVTPGLKRLLEADLGRKFRCQEVTNESGETEYRHEALCPK